MPSGLYFAPSSLFDNLGADIQASLLEFVGTTCFLTLGFGGIQAVASETAEGSNSTVARILYISLSMGFSLLVSAWLFFRVTGGLFNPNVSLALLLTRIIGPVRFVLYCVAQLVGGIAASALVLALTPGDLQAKFVPSNNFPHHHLLNLFALSNSTFLQNGVNPAQGVFIEALITAVLVMAVLMLAAEKVRSITFQ